MGMNDGDRTWVDIYQHNRREDKADGTEDFDLAISLEMALDCGDTPCEDTYECPHEPVVRIRESTPQVMGDPLFGDTRNWERISLNTLHNAVALLIRLDHPEVDYNTFMTGFGKSVRKWMRTKS
jgi:hypothetical protein